MFFQLITASHRLVITSSMWHTCTYFLQREGLLFYEMVECNYASPRDKISKAQLPNPHFFKYIKQRCLQWDISFLVLFILCEERTVLALTTAEGQNRQHANLLFNSLLTVQSLFSPLPNPLSTQQISTQLIIISGLCQSLTPAATSGW